ncbi:MAG: hypothetical protein ACRDRA_13355 [Pseudonocardiaceae bacterium]
MFTLKLMMPSRLTLDLDARDVMPVTLLAVDQGWPGPFSSRASALGMQLADDLDHQLFPGAKVTREIGQRQGRGSARMPVAFTSTLGSPGQVGGLG